MPQSLQFTWQDVVVWLILVLVIFALLHYIGRRLQSLKNIAKKKPESCASCQNCLSSVQFCTQAKNQKDSED